MDQIKASNYVLKKSQKEIFPYFIKYRDLEVEVHKGVFSPKHFNGWKIFTEHFPDFVGKKILEVGCGTGITSLYLAKYGAKKVVAVDINPKAIINTKDNARINGLNNLEVRRSDIYSNIKAEEKFDFIFWNMPFIYILKEFEYSSLLQRSLFDPGYKLTNRFLKQGRNYLKKNGVILVGTGDFGDIELFKKISARHNYSLVELIKENSEEINPVQFILYKLVPEK